MALDLFEERGFEQVSVGQIATAAGISVPTFYAHYPSKEHVVMQVPTAEDIDALMSTQPASLPVAERILGAAPDLVRQVRSQEDRLLTRWQIIAATPSLRSRAAEFERAAAGLVADALPAEPARLADPGGADRRARLPRRVHRGHAGLGRRRGEDRPRGGARRPPSRRSRDSSRRRRDEPAVTGRPPPAPSACAASASRSAAPPVRRAPPRARAAGRRSTGSPPPRAAATPSRRQCSRVITVSWACPSTVCTRFISRRTFFARRPSTGSATSAV